MLRNPGTGPGLRSVVVVVVVLTGTQSHTREAIAGLAQRNGREAEPGARALAVRKLQARLAHVDVAQLVMRYQAGARTTDLARQFGVHRGTVQRLLKREGVLLRGGPATASGGPH